MSSNIEILNDVVHRGVCMRSDVGDAIPHFVPVVVQEFPAASSVCPVFLAKDADAGDFYAAALLGFEPGEMLVDGVGTGRGAFQPLDLQRRGFFAVEENIGIDTAHPRFGAGAVHPLFDDDGGPSAVLRNVQRVLGQLASGLKETDAFVAEMLRLKLVEPVDISLRFDDGRSVTLDGLYTIGRDRLSDLDDADVVALFRRGFLQAALCMSYSLQQIGVLAQRRNDRLTA